MFQFTGVARCGTIRFNLLSSWRLHTQQSFAPCSGAADPKTSHLEPAGNEPDVENVEKRPKRRPQRLSSLNVQKILNISPDEKFDSKKPEGDSIAQVSNGSLSVESLLEVANQESVTPATAFSTVSLLHGLVSSGEAMLSDFEKDERFVKLSNLVTSAEAKPPPPKPIKTEKKVTNFTQLKFHGGDAQASSLTPIQEYLRDISLVLGIENVGEPPKEPPNVPVSHMIQVLSTLAHQKKRPTPLLRSLAYNIAHAKKHLGVKELSDILYSLAKLNYPNEELLARVGKELLPRVRQIDRSPMIGSILRSLGHLRYKDDRILDEFCKAVEKNFAKSEYRLQDISSFLISLVLLDYKPSNLKEIVQILLSKIDEDVITRPSTWLSTVWALCALQLAEDKHVASVLNPNFIQSLAVSSGSIDIPLPHKCNLLNINAAAQLLMEDYDGPLLTEDSGLFANAVLPKSIEKHKYSMSVALTLEQLGTPKCVKINVNSEMGFPYEADFCVNREGKFVPFDEATQQKTFRVAAFALDYHDFCRGTRVPLGIYDLYARFLKVKGYRVIFIPYTEFNVMDDSVKRIVYINDKIRSIVK